MCSKRNNENGDWNKRKIKQAIYITDCGITANERKNMVEQIKTDLDLLWKECFDSELDFTVEQMQFIGLTMSQIKQRLEVSRDTEVILPKPTPLPFTFNGQRLFTYSDLEKAYNDGYKNGMMNEAGLECTLFSSWYNWVHEIKGKSKA